MTTSCMTLLLNVVDLCLCVLCVYVSYKEVCGYVESL